MATSDQVQEKIEAFARQLAEEFGEVDETHALSWLDAIETRAVAIGDAITTELLRQKSADRPPEAEEAVCPKCGELGRYQGPRQRELIGRRGPVVIGEPEYFCPSCRGSSPYSKNQARVRQRSALRSIARSRRRCSER